MLQCRRLQTGWWQHVSFRLLTLQTRARECDDPPDQICARLSAKFYRSLDIQPEPVGHRLTRAAYSPEGAQWV
jgi:hypothetical protein